MGLFAASPLQQRLSFACYLPCFALPQLPPHRRDGAGPALGMPMAFFFTLQTVLNCSHLKGQVWERSCFACSKKSISQIQYLCNEGTVVGITYPSMGQCLQGKQSEARLPRVLIIVLLAAWGKALGLERSNLVADICLPVNVAVADPIPSHLSVCCGIAWHMHGSVMFSGCQCLTLGKV